MFGSIYNSLLIATVSTLVTVTLAFLYAYALTRSCMRFKGAFKIIAMVPILVPSLLAGHRLDLPVRQAEPGAQASRIFGEADRGAALAAPGQRALRPVRGLRAGRHRHRLGVLHLSPCALIIITALSIADARLYEAAVALRAPKPRIFWTVTIPGARYGLISAAFVVFNLVITDFGVPKVIGGQFNVLAVDIYKQVIGQQNFQMGAVVSVVLLIPALIAFTIDRIVQKKQVACCRPGPCPIQPKPSRRFDRLMLAYCCPDGGLHPRHPRRSASTRR